MFPEIYPFKFILFVTLVGKKSNGQLSDHDGCDKGSLVKFFTKILAENFNNI